MELENEKVVFASDRSSTCCLPLPRRATSEHPELDLVIAFDSRTRIAVEVKFRFVPEHLRGMLQAMQDAGCAEGYVVTAGTDAFPIAENVEAMPLATFLESVVLPRRSDG